MQYSIPPNMQAVMGIPTGKLQNHEARIAALEARGGGGQSFENPTSGSADGTNDTFVFTHNPVFLVADDKIIFPTSPSIASITGTYTVKFSFFPQAYVKNAY